MLVLSAYVEEAYALELVADSAAGLGYLLKDRVADVDGFVEAVRRVAEGGSALDPEVVSRLVGRNRRDDPLADLTPREREVLELMAEGRTNAAIAERLVVTERAVEKHVTSIFGKLGLAPRPPTTGGCSRCSPSCALSQAPHSTARARRAGGRRAGSSAWRARGRGCRSPRAGRRCRRARGTRPASRRSAATSPVGVSVEAEDERVAREAVLAHQRQDRGPDRAGDDEAGDGRADLARLATGLRSERSRAPRATRARRWSRGRAQVTASSASQTVSGVATIVVECSSTNGSDSIGTSISSASVPRRHRSEREPQRLLEQRADPAEELGAVGAVEDPVVAGEGDAHQSRRWRSRRRGRPASR